MDIKEIALKVAMDTGLYLDGANQSEPFYVVKPEEIVEFAEAIISAYKAELLKEVGEPVAYKHPTLSKTISIYELVHEQPEWVRDKWVAGQKLYTSDQVAAAVLKATKPLEEQLAKAEQRVAEACKSMCLSLARKEKNHAAGYGIGYLNYSAQDVADFIDNGEWRKFVKEV